MERKKSLEISPDTKTAIHKRAISDAIDYVNMPGATDTEAVFDATIAQRILTKAFKELQLDQEGRLKYLEYFAQAVQDLRSRNKPN